MALGRNGTFDGLNRMKHRRHFDIDEFEQRGWWIHQHLGTSQALQAIDALMQNRLTGCGVG